MNESSTQFWVPNPRKSEVESRLEPVKRAERYRGTCLFVVDDKGRRCGNPVENNCHVIPESAVLDVLKDDHGEILELRWGVARWGHLYVKSSESNPIDLENPDSFEPQRVVTGNACVGWFACKDNRTNTDHDGEFCSIDVKDPDFDDPLVRLLCMYRAVLYESDQCRFGRRLLENYSKQAWRRPDKTLQINWHKLETSVSNRTKWTEAAATQLGIAWVKRKSLSVADADIVSGEAVYFRSRLQFAACVFQYGKNLVVNVSPYEDDRHKMAILHLSNDADIAREDRERLISLASETKDSPKYGCGRA